MSRKTSFYKKHLVCPVCMDVLRDPRELPCLHTFCLSCLHTYIISVTTGSNHALTDGFQCPVCRVHTAAPLHGLGVVCWAENYPPNYTVRDLVDETIKQGITRKWEIPSTTKTGHEGNNKLRIAYTHENQLDLAGKKEAVRVTTTQWLCNSNVSKGLAELHHVEEKPPTHRTLSRISPSFPSDTQHTGVPTLSSQVLAQELSTASGLDSATVPDKQEEQGLLEKASHMTLKRLYGEEKEASHHGGTTVPVSGNLGDLMPASSYKGVDRRLTTSTSKHDQDMLSRDLKEYLSIDVAQQGTGNAVGHLNDIKEEDEDWRQADTQQSVSRSQDKIYVRIRSDDRCCNVTGLTTLPDGRLLIADEHNKNVKVFDPSGKYLSHIAFTSPPFDIDTIEQCEAAVTIPSERCLHVLFITSVLTVVRTIEFDKKCLGISYRDLKFFVALETEIRVLTYEGELLQRFHRNPSKRKLFFSGKSPFLEACYVAVDEHHIHVSDTAKRCMITLNTNGEVVASFKEGEYVKMLGVCRGPECSVFVCQWPNTLFMVSVGEHGSHIRHVLVLDNIQTVHYDIKSQQLWLTQATDNFVNQYSFKCK